MLREKFTTKEEEKLTNGDLNLEFNYIALKLLARKIKVQNFNTKSSIANLEYNQIS